MKYWVVGASHNNKDVSKDFLDKGIWFDGYADDGDNRNQSTLKEVIIGDIFLMKSSSTKGKNRKITFTKLKGIGIVTAKKNEYSFKIKWLGNKELPKDFDGISYRKTIESVRKDKLLIYAKQIVDKNAQDITYSNQLYQFIEQAKTVNQKTKHYIKSYRNLQVKVSFGQGTLARIPWISFLNEPFTTSKGIYPVYLLYKNIDKLVLAYGISETNMPQADWRINNPVKIKNYFSNNSLSLPDRYGESFVFKIYDINNLPKAEILDADLHQIIRQYLSITLENSDPKTNQMDISITKFNKDCAKANLKFSLNLITRYISSLATKPFVLLSGLSGSGKTKLAHSFAQWICENKNQYCIVPVGADWTNREPLLGYVNALDNTEYVLPENGALELIIEVNKDKNKDKPYFLILDEMNLSHVERYFADFLSVMESKDKFKLHSSESNLNITNGDKYATSIEVPKTLDWPKNLFVVGTVNIDETTYMFSPKVLDRANAIEFKINEAEIREFLDTPNEIDLAQIEFKGANMAASFVEIAKNKKIEALNLETLNSTLVKFFVELKKTGAEFGYRTGMEIHRLFHQLSVINIEIAENDKIDIVLMQKLLPKLHGSRRKLCPILEILANLCITKGDAKKDFLDNNESPIYKENADVIYPLSLEKITRMYKGAIDNGFASYAEA